MTMQTLNARRLLCPLPVIRTQDKIKLMQAGEQLEIIATDPGVMQDIPTWSRINGHRVVSMVVADGEYVIVVEVGVNG
ncbi:MAG: sulfurtransferase TusA family protein [Methylococcales bacterium]